MSDWPSSRRCRFAQRNDGPACALPVVEEQRSARSRPALPGFYGDLSACSWGADEADWSLRSHPGVALPGGHLLRGPGSGLARQGEAMAGLATGKPPRTSARATSSSSATWHFTSQSTTARSSYMTGPLAIQPSSGAPTRRPGRTSRPGRSRFRPPPPGMRWPSPATASRRNGCGRSFPARPCLRRRKRAPTVRGHKDERRRRRLAVPSLAEDRPLGRTRASTRSRASAPPGGYPSRSENA